MRDFEVVLLVEVEVGEQQQNTHVISTNDDETTKPLICGEYIYINIYISNSLYLHKKFINLGCAQTCFYSIYCTYVYIIFIKLCQLTKPGGRSPISLKNQAKQFDRKSCV